MSLYQGDFLEGFYVHQAPAFEAWTLAQRARLRELALSALHSLSVYYARRGDEGVPAGINYATRLLSLEPCREETHRQLMLLFARSGQRSAALAQYETCRQLLADKLGVEPGAETTKLYERIRDDRLDGDTGIYGGQGDVVLAPITPPSFLHSANRQPPDSSAPFVAREDELARLDEFLELTLAGKSRIVFVTGNAGSGKTALIREFARQAQAKHSDLAVAAGSCNAFTSVGDPYLPFREILALLTGDVESRWAAGAMEREQAARLWRLIPQSIQALLHTGPDLLDIFIPGQALALRAATAVPKNTAWLNHLKLILAQKAAGKGQVDLKQPDLFAQYSQTLQILAQASPLLLIVDDLQWADAGSINLLFHLGRQLKGSPILIVGIYRPADVAIGRDGERHPLEPVINELHRHFGQIRIDLRRSANKHFVDTFLDSKPNQLDGAFRRSLYRQTRGHALFTVEMVRGLQERGDLALDDQGRWVAGAAVNWDSLPARIEGVIGERIGRLPEPLQESLKVASVEGEVFTAEIVSQVLTTGKLALVRRLSSELDRQHQLVKNQGNHRLDGQRMSQYRFRHILFQKYIYNSLDRSERVYLHEAVGNEIERLYADHSEIVAIQLARHFQEAGLEAKAITHLQTAGEQAVRRYAYEEAITLFNKALALLKNLPQTPARAERELSLQIACANAQIVTKGFAAPEVGEAFTKARELLQNVGETTRLPPVLFGLWVYYVTRAEHIIARELGEDLLKLALSAQNPDILLQAHHALWTSSFILGEFTAARQHVEHGLALYDPQKHQAHAFLYSGHDAGVCGLSFAGPILWCLGYPDQALQKNREALTLAQDLSLPVSLAQALKWLAATHQLRREEAVKERAEAAIIVADEHGYPLFEGWAASLCGWALAQQGQVEAGIAQIQQGLVTYMDTGATMDRPYMLALLAEAYMKTKQVKAGLNTVEKALTIAHETEEGYFEAELVRLKGELLRMQYGDAAAAEVETCFHRSIKIARQQSTKSLELRAVMSLSRLWQHQNKSEQARQVLAETYNWFTEGFDTADLRKTKELLETLA